MKEEDKLLDRYGRNGGWKVPDGYFETVVAEMRGKLPEYPSAPAAVKMTRWQRLKPYVYLAAMFAGIWLMMQVFRTAAGSGPLNLDNPPEQIASILEQPDMRADLQSLIPSDGSYSDISVEEEVSEAYSDFSDLERDLGLALEPEYRDIKLNL